MKKYLSLILILLSAATVFAQQPSNNDSAIKIRGATAIGHEIKPLFVIDGVVYDSARMAGDTLLSANNNPVALLNSNDIETVAVLKDEAAVKAYGSSAKDGVIVITTNKRKKKN